ncbi:MAG TPA: hypothetical protein VN947_28545 [Polyangia bacterium]|nr:hypothetical protein [Polyangia bacterium]
MQPRPLHAFGLGALLAATLVGPIVVLAPSRRMRRERHLKPVERPSDPARAALVTQMHTHGRGMLELVSADAFGATSRTCIHCHESYLTGR